MSEPEKLIKENLESLYREFKDPKFNFERAESLILNALTENKLEVGKIREFNLSSYLRLLRKTIAPTSSDVAINVDPIRHRICSIQFGSVLKIRVFT